MLLFNTVLELSTNNNNREVLFRSPGAGFASISKRVFTARPGSMIQNRERVLRYDDAFYCACIACLSRISLSSVVSARGLREADGL